MSLEAKPYQYAAQEGGLVPISEYRTFPKIDAHVHYDTLSLAFAEQAAADGFKHLISLCADIALSGWPYVEEQHRICKVLTKSIAAAKLNTTLHWACSFHVDTFDDPNFSSSLIQWVDERVQSDGAIAVKFWKNVGMELREKTTGRYVFINDAKFAPLFSHMSTKGVPLACHCGEPRNCWLPVEKMTVNNDAEYFAGNPKYHMHLHPECPSYEDQIVARDAVLKAFPTLTVIGAHLGSLEWSVDELSKRLEAFPQFAVDFAHRMCHLQTQAQSNRDGVIAFFVRFQDQLVYGTDLMFFKDTKEDKEIREMAHETWLSDWKFLSTDEVLTCHEVRGPYKGLALGRGILQKVYWNNAVQRYKIKGAAACRL